MMNQNTQKNGLIQKDEDLAKNWARGDLEAAQNLYQRYERKLIVFFFFNIGHYEDARDLLGETFIRLSQNIDTFRFQSSFKSWVFKIARNLIADYFYQKKRENINLSAFSLTQNEFFEEVTDDGESLHLCLEKLTPKSRIVVYLLHGEEYILADAAELLGLSVEGVRKINLRALEALEKCLSRYGEI